MKITLEEYDSRWPEMFAAEAARIRARLGARALRVEHVGSTAVPGLAAKAVVDVVLEVLDSSEEASYAPELETAGYELRVREPEWFEHRMFRDGAVNLHVFSLACPEIGRMLLFRDWLRGNAADRELYAAAKRELALREWASVDEYARAKSAMVGEILERALK